MKLPTTITIVLLAALVAGAQAQSSREQPEPGYTPGPPSSSQGFNPWNPNTAQGVGQPGFGATLPPGTQFGGPNQAGSDAQPTSSHGRIYPTDLENYDQFPMQATHPAIGPQTPHRRIPGIFEPLPLPGESPAQPSPQPGGNIRLGAPQGFNPATNASPVGLGPAEPQAHGIVSRFP